MNDKLSTIELQPYFVNTREFSYDAYTFMKTGAYCSYPSGTYGYKEYWDEQTRRCMEGYSIGGIRITGPHYFYLNFLQIKATIKESSGLQRKVLTFPKFLDMDYYYFHEVEKARYEGLGVIVAKARRKGFSYKNSALAVHMYNFYRDSTSIIGAYLQEYSDSTMSMSLEMINFINKHTAWTKRKNPDRQDYVKARYKETIEGKETWGGYNSEIFTLTFKENFSAAIGKSASLFLLEEAGKWPGLIDAYMVTAPVFRDGDIAIGQALIFGTGGDVENGSADFAEMFYNPSKYWLKAYDNIWDDGRVGTECGFFISDMWYKPGKVYLPYGNLKEETRTLINIDAPEPNELVMVDMVDEDGNSIQEAAEYYLDRERDNLRNTESRRTWEKYITQSPKTPAEAFLRVSGNIFPVIELNNWLSVLETNNKAKNVGMIGELYWDGDKVKWKPNDKLRPVSKFPINDKDYKEGCVVIWEHPYRDERNETPFGLYISGLDPYDQDQAKSSTSLGSMFVYKTYQSFDKTSNILVAEYTGRPNMANDYYETVRMLLIYYNAKCLYENNLKGLKIYFEQKKSLNLLKEQPGILKDIIPNSKTFRGYGTHMSEPIKIQAEIFLRDWLLEKREDGENGDILNLHTIYSIPLIQELIAYTKDGNYDRVIAFCLVMLHMQDNHRVKVKGLNELMEKPDNMFTRQLFQGKRNTPFRR